MKGEDQLKQELDDFKKEKDRISNIVGQIGGSKGNSNNNLINIAFFGILFALIIFGGVLKKISLEIEIAAAILLVVLKIAWMVHEAQKVSHFQFWILNSLEFRINEMNKKVRNIEKTLKKMEDNGASKVDEEKTDI
ncbi:MULTISPECIES: hypothetical protein [Psychrilyobacter]|uniref:Uncharacterized protein n=1 Tax=Psychrilyobacter piezotolerans TaxID=2293438 RepID=A0ABX9KL87_9FUSO|nr:MULTISPECIES: hypothetical protein [Psychrilyobacter]MCS5421480.1 hypothetical protein [Psychrilyobacter sp. S5]NDI76544.1 hypothetical protein [Psychrilyobacter piezotolerans]RDE66135.1 hypothetical protein DV867_01260 [Psychrilyobacter sp. S5]REI43313.1 hypothetical protein DYH56_01260 [Psychrilyobacter piezotolerans]